MELKLNLSYWLGGYFIVTTIFMVICLGVTFPHPISLISLGLGVIYGLVIARYYRLPRLAKIILGKTYGCSMRLIYQPSRSYFALIEQVTYQSPWLIILDLKVCPNATSQFLVLCKDMLLAKDWRYLQLWLSAQPHLLHKK
jgi:hypothetical protein